MWGLVEGWAWGLVGVDSIPGVIVAPSELALDVENAVFLRERVEVGLDDNEEKRAEE